jgi:hypothetical protein
MIEIPLSLYDEMKARIRAIPNRYVAIRLELPLGGGV